VRVGVGFMQREAATIGEMRHPVAGSTAGLSLVGSALHCRDGSRGWVPRRRQVDSKRSRLEKLPK
jgi:hypothetical protein